MTLPLRINETLEWLPSECRSHSGGDSAVLGIAPSSPTSWDLGQYLFGDNWVLNQFNKTKASTEHWRDYYTKILMHGLKGELNQRHRLT